MAGSTLVLHLSPMSAWLGLCSAPILPFLVGPLASIVISAILTRIGQAYDGRRFCSSRKIRLSCGLRRHHNRSPSPPRAIFLPPKPLTSFFTVPSEGDTGSAEAAAAATAVTPHDLPPTSTHKAPNPPRLLIRLCLPFRRLTNRRFRLPCRLRAPSPP